MSCKKGENVETLKEKGKTSFKFLFSRHEMSAGKPKKKSTFVKISYKFTIRHQFAKLRRDYAFFLGKCVF